MVDPFNRYCWTKKTNYYRLKIYTAKAAEFKESTDRGSHLRCSVKIGTLKYFAIFTRKHSGKTSKL